MVNEIKLINGKAIIEKKFEYGNNSLCLLVKYMDTKYVLKLMSINSDIDVTFDFMPKVLESGKSMYDDEKVDYKLYEYIDGDLLLNKKTLSLDEIINLIHIPVVLINHGYTFNDINASNFIFKEEKAYLVDYGSISIVEAIFNSKNYNLIYISNDARYCYELRQKFMKSIDEKITIYCFGKMIKECTNLLLNPNLERIIDKMSSYYRNRRYDTFLEVYNDLILLKDKVIF